MDNYEEIKHPKTNCIFKNSKVIACDDYLKKVDGETARDYDCCKSCGWNPKVSEKRLKKIYEERRAIRAMQ